jgi:LacI family transcriptional regulator
MGQRRSVALLIETSNNYARGILDGIIAYVREHESWSIYLPEQQRGGRPPAWLSHWRGDGIIARIENDRIAKAVQHTGLPVVDVSAARMIASLPWVETDDEAITRLAIEHLLERGFRRLAFCGDPRFNWSRWRCEHFGRMAKEAGCSVWTHQALSSESWNREHARLIVWLRQLPRPIGVMACYDIKGQQVLDACRDLGIAVPEEIAVIGVDNDRLICELCMPQLSSVMPNTQRTGYVAAELLAQWMGGKRLKGIAHPIEPLGICLRRSSDILAIDDPEVAAAVRFIRERACDRINVEDVLRAVPISRRILESRFLKQLGRTPHDEILRVKIDRVKRLLSDTDLPMNTIAQLAGFSGEDYLGVAFKRSVGISPGAYRANISRRAGPG